MKALSEMKEGGNMSKRREQQSVIADEQIIELYWQRNENAIQETDKKYGQFLFKIAYNILHDRLDCEECQNDTYLGVWNAIPPTRPIAFPAFITQIMRNIAINRFKEKTSKKRIPSELTVTMDDVNDTLHSNDTVEGEYAAEEVGKIINDYVRELSDRQRYIFIDRFYLAEPVETIAKDLSISVPTVYREIEKIKQGLKLHLERNDIFI